MLPSPLDLNYFAEIASALSFSKAARKLNVSQPSLTLAIKRLENLLKEKLFIRHKQGVTLTRAGHELLHNVHELMDKWAYTKSNVHQSHQAVKGHVTISCNSTLASLLSNLFSELIAKHSELEIHLKHGHTQKIMEDIACGYADVGVVVLPDHHADVVLTKIGSIEFCFWSAINSGSHDLTSSELLVICDTNLPVSQILLNKLQIFRKQNVRLITSNQFEVIAAMTTDKCGIGILPACLVETLYADQLQRVNHAPNIGVPMYLARNAQARDIVAIKTIWQALKELAFKKFPQ